VTVPVSWWACSLALSPNFTLSESRSAEFGAVGEGRGRDGLGWALVATAGLLAEVEARRPQRPVVGEYAVGVLRPALGGARAERTGARSGVVRTAPG